MVIQSLRRWGQFGSLSCVAMAACVALALLQLPARGDDLVKHPTFYRTTKVDGLSIFYRETGPGDAPTPPAARVSLVIADVRAALRPTF
jgi:hypothetical protein